MDIKALHRYANKDFSLIKADMKEQRYEFAYGEYSISEIRKALTDGQPVIMKNKTKSLVIIGEDEKSLYSMSESGKILRLAKSIVDSIDNNSGLIVVNGPKHTKRVENKSDYIIYTPNQDTWAIEKNDMKEYSKNVINKLNEICKKYMPTHPLILSFKEPGKKEIKEGIRSMINGASISIYDHTDPVSEAFHEMGHAYYRTRLLTEEKAFLKDLHIELDSKDQLPAIFVDKWGWVNPEEMFCTMYMWYLRKMMLNNGYGEIFEDQFKEGYDLLESIFNRVWSEVMASKEWIENEEDISTWLKAITSDSIKMKMGKKLIKARIPHKTPKSLVIPRGTDYTLLYEYEGQQWVSFNTGILKAKTVVVKDGALDIEHMKKHGRNLHIVPVKRRYIRGDKETYRTVYVDIGELLPR